MSTDQMLQCYTSSLPTMSDEMKDAFNNYNGNSSRPDMDIDDLMTILNEGQSPLSPEQIEISILPCQKTRGRTYVEENKRLVTKPHKWVTVRCEGLKAEHLIRVHLRYEDRDYYANVAVWCNNNCISEVLKEVEGTKATFIIKREQDFIFTKSSDADGHPKVVFNAKDGANEFGIAFRCRNSCDSHKQYNSRRKLIIEVIDRNTGVVEMKEEYMLRVCESVSRDHKQIANDQPPAKRLKASSSTSNLNILYPGSNFTDGTIVHLIEDNPSTDFITCGGQEKKAATTPLTPVTYVPKFIKTEPASIPHDSEPLQYQVDCTPQPNKTDSGNKLGLFARLKNPEDVAIVMKLIERLGGSATQIKI